MMIMCWLRFGSEVGFLRYFHCLHRPLSKKIIVSDNYRHSYLRMTNSNAKTCTVLPRLTLKTAKIYMECNRPRSMIFN